MAKYDLAGTALLVCIDGVFRPDLSRTEQLPGEATIGSLKDALEGACATNARGVSADGSIVVGDVFWNCAGPVTRRAFRWTENDGMAELPASGASRVAHGVANNGAIIGEWVPEPGAFARAARWTADGAFEDLAQPDWVISSAVAISSDGSTVVGDYTSFIYPQAFRWTASGGMQDLGFGLNSRATEVSDDGSIVVGFANGRIIRWEAATGAQDLGPGRALDVSADGQVVVGLHEPVPMAPGFAFRWTASEGQELFGVGIARGVGADGSVVIGTMRFPPSGQTGPFRLQSSVLGQSYCRPGHPNSSGCGGIVLATGTPTASGGALQLQATLLPQNSFGYFLTSRTQGFTSGIPNNQGNICLAGDIGRFVGTGQIMNSGASGAFTLTVDLTMVPTPTGLTAVLPGQTWNFQAWHRDANPMVTSNFTDAVSITFN